METPKSWLEYIYPWLLVASVAVIIAVTAYIFLVTKNYDFFVEAACDSQTQTCYYRDCSEEDVCPPNGLEVYTIYGIVAADFKKCSNNSCAAECQAGSIACEEIVCGESEEDVCIDPASSEGE